MCLQMFNISDFSSDLHNQSTSTDFVWDCCLNYCFSPWFINVFVIPKSEAFLQSFCLHIQDYWCMPKEREREKKTNKNKECQLFLPCSLTLALASTSLFLFFSCSTSEPWHLLWWIGKPISSILALDIEFVCMDIEFVCRDYPPLDNACSIWEVTDTTLVWVLLRTLCMVYQVAPTEHYNFECHK